MTVQELTNRLDLKVFSMGNPDTDVEGAYCGDLLSWVMGRADMGNAWLTIMSNQNVAAVAVMADVSCVILTEGVEPDAQLLEKSEKEGLNLLGTKLSTYEAAAELSTII